MEEYKDVQLTRPYELLFLLLSSFTLFILMIIGARKVYEASFVSILIALLVSIIYFFALKRRFIRKIDFRLFDNRFEYDATNVFFSSISEYKIHWMKGAGLKMKLKNGKTIRLSSNNNLCNADMFVNFCLDLDDKIEHLEDSKIVRKKSFFETKFGYYYWVFICLAYLMMFVYLCNSDKDLNFSSYLIISISLAVVWLSYTLYKKRW